MRRAAEAHPETVETHTRLRQKGKNNLCRLYPFSRALLGLSKRYRAKYVEMGSR